MPLSAYIISPYDILARLSQLRHQLGSIYDFHKLLAECFRLGRFLRTEHPHRLEAEQRVGLALLAGGPLQRDLRDHTADWRQSTEQPGGVFQEPGFACHGDPH